MIEARSFSLNMNLSTYTFSVSTGICLLTSKLIVSNGFKKFSKKSFNLVENWVGEAREVIEGDGPFNLEV